MPTNLLGDPLTNQNTEGPSPPLYPAVALRRKNRWRDAQAHSGLTAQGIADMLGVTKSLV